MAKNTSSFGDIQITPLVGQFDLRSPSGTLPITDFRLVLNASMNEFGKRCRRPGFRKYGAGSPRGFNNQDLHSKLGDSMDNCEPTQNNCLCAGVPDCLRLVDYVYGAVLQNCVDGQDSTAPAWDGTLEKMGDCSWGFSYFTYSFGGKEAAVILSLSSCANNIPIYELEIVVRLDDGRGLIVWKGTSSHVPIGTYTRTDGCDETESILVESCIPCDQPVITANPPSGMIMAGSYVSLMATDGAVIFFTTDGTAPDNTSELYVSPFQLTEDTTVRAIAYTPSCISDVEEFAYDVLGDEEFLFQFTCDNEDQAGVFGEFEPNGSPDYNWRLRFTLPEVDIDSLEIYETNPSGLWVTGQSWGTRFLLFPEELNGQSYSTYPVVIYEGSNQLNIGYTPIGDVMIADLPAGTHEWRMFGQPFIPLVGYFKLIFRYVEGAEEKVIQALIPHDCDTYYDDYDGYGVDCEETEAITSVDLEGTQRNDITTFAGMQFEVGNEDIVVTHLGRWKRSGNTGTHTLRIMDESENIVATAEVDMTAYPVDQFAYVNLPSDVVLQANTIYYLLSEEDSGQDEFLGDEAGDFNIVSSVARITVTGAAYFDGGSFTFFDGEGFSFGPVSLMYCE